MKSRINNNHGFTLVEMMVSFLTLTLCVMGVLNLSNSLILIDRDTRVQSRLYSDGMHIMERIQRGDLALHGLMKARSDSIMISTDVDSGDQNQIDFSVDKNDTYTASTLDDVVMSIYFDDGDGDDATYNDNTVMMDVNVNSIGDDIVLGSNVESLEFSQSGDVINFDLVLTEDVNGNEASVRLSRSVYMRN